MRLKLVLHNKRSHCNEKPAHHNVEEPLLLPTRESQHAATKTSATPIYIHTHIYMYKRSALVIQWLRFRAFTAMGPGSIVGWGTKIAQDPQHHQKKKKE